LPFVAESVDEPAARIPRIATNRNTRGGSPAIITRTDPKSILHLLARGRLKTHRRSLAGLQCLPISPASSLDRASIDLDAPMPQELLAPPRLLTGLHTPPAWRTIRHRATGLQIPPHRVADYPQSLGDVLRPPP
jgi:hypothetical protein